MAKTYLFEYSRPLNGFDGNPIPGFELLTFGELAYNLVRAPIATKERQAAADVRTLAELAPILYQLKVKGEGILAVEDAGLAALNEAGSACTGGAELLCAYLAIIKEAQTGE